MNTLPLGIHQVPGFSSQASVVKSLSQNGSRILGKRKGFDQVEKRSSKVC
jgi:hypothetical protein